ncbi:MAG: hypothetical protein AAB131_06060 [Actinomycetota bacterium]|nr:MAG: hypothetical protein FD127_911 [Acidimicrobiaceae bacterium]
MDFIFMLTRSDETVVDCLETWDAIDDVGLRHAGFKDVGADTATLIELNRRMQAGGVTTYLEVVSTSAEECLRSARAAIAIGVDRLMGGTQVDEIMQIIEGRGIEYLPFPGLPVGHPTTLGGGPTLVQEQCEEFDRRGCGGVDLLAYRATEADPIELVRAARRGTRGYLVVAGGVCTVGQIESLRGAGADAFTIGSAVFDGSFSPRKGHIASQLRDVLEATGG